MGVAHKAEHILLERTVALKVLASHLLMPEPLEPALEPGKLQAASGREFPSPYVLQPSHLPGSESQVAQMWVHAGSDAFFGRADGFLRVRIALTQSCNSIAATPGR